MRNTDKDLQRGEILEPLLILFGLAVIMVFFILPSSGIIGPRDNFNRVTNPTTYGNYAESQSTRGPVLTTNSAYSSLISIGLGNAAYSVEPSEEYITIENDGSSPVNITGWKLENNKGNKTFVQSGNQVHYPSDQATIPQAVGYISPSGFNILQNVVLKPGENAIVTTGSNAVQNPYKITSFKENECSGYLEALPQYDFTPALGYSCIPPSQEPGIENLDRSCRNFISSISACQTPRLGKIDQYSNDNCANCVNGQPAPSDACFSFIKAHFSYQGCIDNHANDPKFYSKTWRVFLGQPWEMWGKEDEVISLFDQFGKLVSYKSY